MSEYISSHFLVETNKTPFAVLRKYNKTRQKDEWALRCKNPLFVNEYKLDIFPLLNVDRDSFKALFEVDYRADIICNTLNCILKGDKKLLGH